MKDSYLGQAWLVLSLALVFGAALAGVQAGLSDRIAANKVNETYDQIPYLLDLIDDDGNVTIEVSVRIWKTADDKLAYQAVDPNGAVVGWVIKGVGPGFQDRIELLIGLDPEAETITGLFVLDQKETPALGSRIKEDGFREQFVGMSAAEEVVVVRTSPRPEANEVVAISGATISSVAVGDIVNAAVEDFRARKGDLELKD